MDSSMMCWNSLKLEDNCLDRGIFSLGISLTGDTTLFRPLSFSFVTNLSTLKTSFYSEATMNLGKLPPSMVFMIKSWKNMAVQHHGSTSIKLLITFRLEHSLKTRFSAFMEDCHLKLKRSIKWERLTEKWKSLTKVTFYIILGAFCDLMWSDPENIEAWAPNNRGAGWIFGTKVVRDFNYINGI